MLWIILVVLVILVAVAIAAGTQKRENINAQAEFERLKRLSPEDPLSQIGPAEFERAYGEVREAKGRKGCSMLVYFFLALLVGAPLLGWMAYSLAGESAGTGIIVWALAVLGCMVYLFKGRKVDNGAPTHAELKARLGLDTPAGAASPDQDG